MLLLTQLSFSQAIKINSNNNLPNELTVAVNPMDNRYVAAASNINNLYLSSDSGKTWRERELKSSFGVYGDPVLRYDQAGRLYIAHLAKNRRYKQKDPDFYAALDRIVVQCSYDNGNTFDDGNFCGYVNGRMQDKPWIAFDSANNIYISWTEFDKYASKDPSHHSRVRFFKTNVGWLDTLTVTVSDVEGNCEDRDSTPEGATIAIGKNGEVYCCWAAFGKIYVDRSIDGGKSWGKDIVAATQRGGWTFDLPSVYRTNGMPFLVSAGDEGLYIVYSEQCESIDHCTQTQLIQSIDGGLNWKWIRSLDADKPAPNHYSFTPNMAYNSSNKSLGIVFYETALSPSGKYAKVIGGSYQLQNSVYSTKSVSNYFPLTGKTIFFGDYIDIATMADQFIVSWNQPDTLSLSCYAAWFDKNRSVADELEISNNPFRLNTEGISTSLMVHAEFKDADKWNLKYRPTGMGRFKNMKVVSVVKVLANAGSSGRLAQEVYFKTPVSMGNSRYDFILTVGGRIYEYKNLYIPIYRDGF